MGVHKRMFYTPFLNPVLMFLFADVWCWCHWLHWQHTTFSHKGFSI